MTVVRLPPLPTPRDIIKLYKIGALKRLSQNFLLDERICDKIVKCAGNISDAQVLEVGPGTGSITRSIIKQNPQKLIVVEKDRRFKPTLEMVADAFSTVGGKMDIIFDDIRSLNMTAVFSEDEKKDWEDKSPNIHLIGNLPFNVATPLIIQWLEAISKRSSAWSFGRTQFTLTFQKEVAERIVARETENQRCRLSVMAQTWTHPTLRFIIPGKAFIPKPDVDVGVVTFKPLVNPETKHDFKLFEKITRHIFCYRRKYNIRCIETLFPPECRKELSLMMFKLTDLEPTLLSTQLTVNDIDRLTTAYKYLAEKHPEILTYNYRASRRVLASKHTKEIVVEDCDEMEDAEIDMSQ